MKQNLREIGKLFLKLGFIAFGGPAAHIAMMEEEVVNKRKWMSRQHFLDLIGASNIIPGPNSTEMTMHCGYEKGGWKGLFLAGFTFIGPAVLITLVFAILYKNYGELPNVEMFIFGIKPAVIAIILGAVYRLGKKALKGYELGILGLVTFVACIFGFNEIAALFICGGLGVLLFLGKSGLKTTNGFFPIIPLAITGSTLKYFLIFLKVGALLYGSGYVLFAYLDAELVNTGILTRQEILDAVAVGQFTPGPVLSTATFIGYQINGIPGAIVATVGIFLPSFIFVWILNPLIPKIRKSKLLSSFLDAVNIGAMAVIAAVCFEMGKETILDWKSSVIAILSILIVFFLKKINPAWIVLGGGLLGYLLSLI